MTKDERIELMEEALMAADQLIRFDSRDFPVPYFRIKKYRELRSATLASHPTPRGKVDYSGVVPTICSKELHYQHEETGTRCERLCTKDWQHDGSCEPIVHPGHRWYICAPSASPDEQGGVHDGYRVCSTCKGYGSVFGRTGEAVPSSDTVECPACVGEGLESLHPPEADKQGGES